MKHVYIPPIQRYIHKKLKVKEIVESQVLIYLVVVFDAILTLGRAGCSRHEPGSPQYNMCSKAVVGVFASLGITYLTVSITAVACLVVNTHTTKCSLRNGLSCKENVRECNGKYHGVRSDVTACLLQAIPGILYYVGDNFGTVVNEYGDGLSPKCGDETTCYKGAQIVSIYCLLTSGVIFVAYLSKGVVNTVKRKDEKKFNNATEAMRGQLPIMFLVLQIPIVDIIYTGIVPAVTFSDSACTGFLQNHHKVSTEWYITIVALVCVTLFVIVCLEHWYSPNKQQQPKQQQQSTMTRRKLFQIIHVNVVVILIVSYMLADNNFPLFCELPSAHYRLQLLFSIVTMAILLYVAVFALCFHCKQHREKERWERSGDQGIGQEQDKKKESIV